MKTIRELLDIVCDVSDPIDMRYYDRFDKPDLPSEALEMLAAYAYPRAEAFGHWMTEQGFDTTYDGFIYHGTRGRNVICTKGTPRHWCVAHHDYWGGVGADDNGSGLSVMMDCAQGIERDDIGFISFDLEEAGRIGSRKFTQEYDIRGIHSLLCIDTVSSGEGVMAAFSTLTASGPCSELFEETYTCSDEELVNSFTKGARDIGYRVYPGYMMGGSSDSKSFPLKVPKLSLYSFMHAGNHDGWYGKGLKGYTNHEIVHTEKDCPDNIDQRSLAAVSHAVRNYLEDLP